MKKIVEKIKEIYKLPRGKAILFFSFYFVLFAILIIVIRLNIGKEFTGEYEEGIKSSLDVSSVTNNNYHFKYKVIVDDKENIFEGDKLKEEELFSFNNKEYYKKENKFYTTEDGKETSNPYIFKEFLDSEMLEKIVSNSYLEYETNYQSGQTKYNFLVSSNTLNELINNENTDIEEKPNTITISVEEDNINSIIYHLDSYCLNRKSCKKSLEIELEFENIGEIKKIKSPIA